MCSFHGISGIGVLHGRVKAQPDDRAIKLRDNALPFTSHFKILRLCHKENNDTLHAASRFNKGT